MNGLVCILALYAFWAFKYPVATSLLTLTGQIDQIGLLVYEQNARLEEILNIN